MDESGHKNYVPNMISSASHTDIGVLVTSVRWREQGHGDSATNREEFEHYQGSDRGYAIDLLQL